MEEEKDVRNGKLEAANKNPTQTNIWDYCTLKYSDNISSKLYVKTLVKRITKTAVFIGDRSSGKSTLLQAFLNKSAKREASSPIEYNFGRKSSFTSSSKELAHLYEIGGGRAFADLIQIPISPEHYLNTVIVIVLDLSKPYSLLSSLTFWLDTIRKIIPERSYKDIPEDTLKGTVNKIWTTHEDRKYIEIIPIPVVVVANKYDQFIKEDP